MGGCIDRLDWVLCCLRGKKEMLFVGLPPYTYSTSPLLQINIARMLCQNMLSNQGIASQPVCKLHAAVSRPEFRSLSITLLAAKERSQGSELDGKDTRSQKMPLARWLGVLNDFAQGPAYTVPPTLAHAAH